MSKVKKTAVRQKAMVMMRTRLKVTTTTQWSWSKALLKKKGFKCLCRQVKTRLALKMRRQSPSSLQISRPMRKALRPWRSHHKHKQIRIPMPKPQSSTKKIAYNNTPMISSLTRIGRQSYIRSTRQSRKARKKISAKKSPTATSRTPRTKNTTTGAAASLDP